jgi:uncharacterized protein (TIGR02302 family)
LRQARFALLWESTWPLLWPIPALIFAFIAVALLGIPSALPGWLHLAFLIVCGAALLVLLWRLHKIKRPTEAQMRQRLERASGLSHGPLQTLADTLASGDSDPVAQSLWEAYRRRAAATLAQLKWPWPGPVLPRHDPWGLRFLALLLLAIALPGGWRDAPAKLERAFDPDLQWLIGAPPVLQVWITPPDYTRVAPILLQNVPTGPAITVPSGSKLLAELQGGSGAATLELGGTKQNFQALDASSARLETTIGDGGDLVIRQGWRKVGAWHIDTAADQPPTIEFAKMPDADRDGRLRFEIDAADDYGVAKAWVEIARPKRPDQRPVTVAIPLAGHPKTVHQSTWHDLTSNPWAGLEVTLTPKDADDAGQVGTGGPLTITLPERIFRHPVARAIVALRKQLAMDPDDRDIVIEGLEDIYERPERWGNDTVVALGLADVMSRLTYDGTDAGFDSVLETLWQTALRLEEGDRPNAERAVDDAAQALEKALQDNAPEPEIDRLTAELKAAIDRLLQALVQQALQNGDQLPQPLPGQKTLSQDDLNRMLDQMKDLSRTGSRDAARQTLDQLRQMLDNLRAGKPMTASREQMEQAKKLSDELQAITKEQQDLLDETFRRAQQGKPKGAENQSGADRQEALRKRLDEAMQSLGDMGADIPDALGEAEQQMRAAKEGLGEGDLEGAVQAQTQALEKLREGAQQANRGMAQRLGNGFGMVQGSPQQGGGDPLGRQIDRNGGSNPNDDSVKIPTQSDLQKAREVLDELRRRSGDPHRPTAERDYLDRLLKELY